ncbi:ArsR/SmtB family transcription factor [Haladaptatus halobius]|uniref:ArsR/SmtB family transcription factor n=1 Tax=Haladaptatus halobius TaxID=2884875 RepID=UPI001D0AA06F|nr:helix-turn-helix domain-containing protein [Haladaptatus halobius]
MSLLPSKTPEIDTEQAGDIQILGVDEQDTDVVFNTLSSQTARKLLVAINEEPGTPSELANRLDTSIQTVSYHLDALVEAELIRVADTRYSEKGREMKIYAPGENLVVLVVGTEESAHGIRSLLKRFLGAIGALALLSLIVHSVVEEFPFMAQTAAGGQPEPTGWPTGIAFFVGGFVILLIVFWWQGSQQ